MRNKGPQKLRKKGSNCRQRQFPRPLTNLMGNIFDEKMAEKSQNTETVFEEKNGNAFQNNCRFFK
jgi:hypothetical protein